jgi:hypothetical protein
MIDRVALDHLSDGLTANRSVTDLRLNSLKFGEYIPEPSPSLQKVDLVICAFDTPNTKAIEK